MKFMKLMVGQKIYGKVMHKNVIKYIDLLIKSSGYKTATLFAPGISGLNLFPLIDIVQVVDYDRYLPYENYEIKDCIFDKIDICGDVIITLHTEKLYPPNKIYTNREHIMVLDTRLHNGNCTKKEHIAQLLEMESIERWLIYST